MGGAGHHAEIVYLYPGVYLRELFRHGLAQLVELLVVAVYGVHMYGGQDAELLPYLPLRLVHGVMEPEYLTLAVDLGVEGHEATAGAVVVDYQVVDANYLRMGQGGLLYLLHQLRVRGLAQQRGEGISQSVVAGKDDKGGYQQSRPAVHVHMEEIGHAHGQQNHGGCYGVGERVGGGGLHGGGAYLSAHGLVVAAHVELHGNGGQQDDSGQQPRLHRLRVDYLLDGALAQLNAHGHYQGRQQHARQVLRPAVAEGVVQVRLLTGNGKAQKAYNGGTRVGQVIESVRHNGHGAGNGSGKVLACKEQHIEENAVHGAKGAVGTAHRRVVHLIPVLYEDF